MIKSLLHVMAIVAICSVACLMVAQPNARAYPDSGASDGQVAQVPQGGYRSVSPDQLWEMLPGKDFVLVNVRVPYDGELPQTDLFIPYNEVDKNLDRLPLDKSSNIVVYCRSGRTSAIAAEKLVSLGYTNVWSLEGGMQGWGQRGYPLLQKPR